MKAIAFRFTDGEKPTGWIGLAVGIDWLDLFWTIDEFGDPFCCEYRPIKAGAAVCWLELKIDPEHFKRSSLLSSEQIPSMDDKDGWKPFPASLAAKEIT